MYNGDQARVLIEHGFRLPSAADNRLLKGDEFWERNALCRLSHPGAMGDGGERRRGGRAGDPPYRGFDPVVEVRPRRGRWTTVGGDP